jgi:hypothetical protein
VDHEARYVAGERPGSGLWNLAAGRLREMIDAQLELSLPKTWIVRQADRRKTLPRGWFVTRVGWRGSRQAHGIDAERALRARLHRREGCIDDVTVPEGAVAFAGAGCASAVCAHRR